MPSKIEGEAEGIGCGDVIASFGACIFVVGGGDLVVACRASFAFSCEASDGEDSARVLFERADEGDSEGVGR